jgi:hypothetical protein
MLIGQKWIELIEIWNKIFEDLIGFFKRHQLSTPLSFSWQDQLMICVCFERWRIAYSDSYTCVKWLTVLFGQSIKICYNVTKLFCDVSILPPWVHKCCSYFLDSVRRCDHRVDGDSRTSSVVISTPYYRSYTALRSTHSAPTALSTFNSSLAALSGPKCSLTTLSRRV